MDEKYGYLKIQSSDGYTDAMGIGIFYYIGGTNPFGKIEEKRGYYMVLGPILDRDFYKGFSPFNTGKKLVVSCKKRSKSAFNEAVEVMNKEAIKEIKKRFPHYKLESENVTWIK